MDNGSGSALLLDIAAHLAAVEDEAAPFAALCLGHGGRKRTARIAILRRAIPLCPAKSIVADVNTDMFLPIFPLKVVTVYGLDESDLGDMIRQVAAKENVASAARSRAAAQHLYSQ